MRMSDWSSDVCSSDVRLPFAREQQHPRVAGAVFVAVLGVDRLARRHCEAVVVDREIPVARCLAMHLDPGKRLGPERAVADSDEEDSADKLAVAPNEEVEVERGRSTDVRHEGKQGGK